MPQWIIDIFGDSLAPFVWVAVVAALVCTLAIVVLLMAKKLMAGGVKIGPKVKAPRLQVLDVVRVDEKRKLVLVRRDEVEHLVLVGGQTDILVEGSILRLPSPARGRPSDGDARLDSPAMAPQQPRVAAAPPVAGGTTTTPRQEPRRDSQPAPQRAPAVAAVPAPAAPVLAPQPTPPRRAAPTPGAAPAPEINLDRARPVEAKSPRSQAATRAEPALPPATPSTDRHIPLSERLPRLRPAAPRAEVPTERAAPQPAMPLAERASLNPSTHPFSRATPTLPSKAEPDLSMAPVAEPAPRPSGRIEPQLAMPGETYSDARLEPEPARREARALRPAGDRTSGDGDAATAPLPSGSGDVEWPSADTQARPRPLSVRSFVSAVQSRDTSERGVAAVSSAGPKIPARAAEPRPVPTGPGPAAPHLPQAESRKTIEQPAPQASAEKNALEKSLEDFLAAELHSSLAEEALEAKEPRPPQPKPAATPAKATASDIAEHPAPASAPAQAKPSPSEPVPTAKPKPAPSSADPQPAAKPKSDSPETVMPIPHPLSATAQGKVDTPQAAELDLEEEMKRLLGELGATTAESDKKTK
ncbi:flagellar biosynthetic protein FliO [Jiella sp. MQZ9-1]|uniref:Flagellar biosynthetic protein FliO n=1 Tax=Jiella flava TaxID=2816857 RepID=A0A939JWX5_9HYPH|nr:flagellar biosynthetic protein FliO [Jiella flava]MBO0662766.1 flagellar biosynthetic protein FliO [Jiella flava]MCD2471188.1 flagellar biosynthetic protein FliO [Jiella flava]